MSLALINGRVLSDAGFEEGRVVVLAAGRIEAVLGHDQWQAERARRDGKQSVYDLKGQRLVPGFVDTQVNGGGGVLFNDDPSVDSIVEIGRAHRRYGTTGFLPTLISDDLDVVVQAVRAVQTAMEIGVPGVLGIHIEGPFLNEERKGVHDVTKLRWLDEDALGLLTALNGGRTVVTLAPEGSALSAGLAPEMVAPRTTASARNGMYRRKRRTTGGISMSPFFRASVAAVLCAPSRA